MVEQTAALLSHLHGKLRRRLRAGDLIEAAGVRIAAAAQRRFVEQMAAAALLALLMACQVEGLAHGDHHQQPPQVVAVGELGKPALLGAAAKAVEGTEGDVFLVGEALRRAVELLPGQVDELREIALPEPLRGVIVAAFEPVNPVAD